MPSRSVLVLGGGLIGLTTALALHERGAAVGVVDTAAMGSGAARGNSGFVSPTLMAPLAGPGMLRRAAGALVRRDAPLRIRPRAVPSMLRWGIGLLRASSRERFSAAQAALAELNKDVDRLLGDLAALGVDVSLGQEILVPLHDVAFAERFHAELLHMSRFGPAAPGELLGGDEVRRIVPALTDHVRAGFILPGNRTLDPGRYVDTLITALEDRGVDLLGHCRITGFDVRGGRVHRVRTSRGPLDADEVVLAAGAGIRALGRMLGLRLEVVAGQGYNISLPTDAGLDRAVIIEEIHAVATPFADRIRVGGTMELAGDSPPFDGRRIDAVVRSMRPYLDLEWTAQRDPWAGSRPMSADGLPLIGRPRALSNVVVAGGHGMFGLTLAPATASVVAELIVDGGTSVDLSPFDPDR